MLGIYRVAAQLVASRVVLSSTELVSSENSLDITIKPQSIETISHECHFVILYSTTTKITIPKVAQMIVLVMLPSHKFMYSKSRVKTNNTYENNIIRTNLCY
jgi:hypothetical protein